MKSDVTKFNLEDAFKALDEINIPKVRGVRPNKIDIRESTKRVDRFDLLMEDYYDVNSGADLEQAKVDREDEIAKAKLARIEKIVDLDATSPDELLPSYVGKYIMQCPQCMTLFYKDEADVEKSEEDDSIVNVGEVCQHCGNDTGYTLIGKVDNVSADEVDKYTDTAPAEETQAESTEETTTEETTEEPNNEADTEANDEADNVVDLDLDLGTDSDETTEETEEKKKEESLYINKEFKKINKRSASEYDSENLSLHESTDFRQINFENIASPEIVAILRRIAKHAAIEGKDLTNDADRNELISEYCSEREQRLLTDIPDKNGNYYSFYHPSPIMTAESLNLRESADLDSKLKDFNNYVNYLNKMIKDEEAALANATNSLIKDAIQRRIDAFKSDLDSALPEVIKAEAETEDLPTPEDVDVDAENKEEAPAEETNESLNNNKEFKNISKKRASKNDSENLTLNESGELVYSEAALDDMFGSKEFKTPISDKAVQDMLGEDYVAVDDVEEDSFNEQFNTYLTRVYSNVKSFALTEGAINGKQISLTGDITFKSGNVKPTTFVFEASQLSKNKYSLFGMNEDFSDRKAFNLTCRKVANQLIAENLAYNYKIGKNIVEGFTK